MRLRRLTVSNFRCYVETTSIDFDDLTAIVGANDVGKSTLLEALSIFLGEQKLDASDVAIAAEEQEVRIKCEFEDPPARIVVDAEYETSLEDEYLLTAEGRVAIEQVFDCTLKTIKPKIFIFAEHPSAELASDLLTLKNTDLKRRAEEQGVDLSSIDKRVNAALRSAIRTTLGHLTTTPQLVPAEGEGTKDIYAKLKEALPKLFLFRADREGTDQDAEAQDPLKASVLAAMNEQQSELDDLAEKVRERLNVIANKTVEKLRDVRPDIADQLTPEISDPKWESVFKVGLRDQRGVPINKRGSGVRRLVLLAFLQAEVDRFKDDHPGTDVIYAIEEPETSQHPDSQRALLSAFQEISEDSNHQVFLTTHTPNLARLLPVADLRLVRHQDKQPVVEPGTSEEIRDAIRQSLGVMADHDVRVFVGVEGTNDEKCLLHLSGIIAAEDENVTPLADLVKAGRVIFLPLGGSSLAAWTNRLQGLECPEFHLYDRDAAPGATPVYQRSIDDMNQRDGCEAHALEKSELENYLHEDAINAAYTDVGISVGAVNDTVDVPAMVARAVHEKGGGAPWDELDTKKIRQKTSRVKNRLNDDAAANMTVDLLKARGGFDELAGHFRKITELATT